MALVFLVPALLAATAAVVIPIALHLRRREREQPMRFSSLMFLRRVTVVSARRRRITDWPLLLLRALIVLLLVLAFSRPVFRAHIDRTAGVSSRRVVIAIDRSMSMSHEAVWPAALDSARHLIQALAPGDRVAVVAFDDHADVEESFTTDQAAALAVVGRLRPGSSGTRYGTAMRAAREVLEREAGATGGTVDVVTDLQRPSDPLLSGVTLPPATTLRVIAASNGHHGNSAVVGVTARRAGGADSGHRDLAISAVLVSHGLPAPRRARASLVVNGRDAGARDVVLPADGAVTVAFNLVPASIGAARVTVSLTPDSLPADDHFDAIVPPQLGRRVLLVTASDALAEESFYLSRALAIGDDPALTVVRASVRTLTPALLRGSEAVILDDVSPPSAPAGPLAAYVHDGGGLLVLVGARLARGAVASPLLPATVRGMVERTTGAAGAFGAVRFDHPLFSAFRGGDASSLGLSHFYRYPRLAPASDAAILATFDDGLPAVAESRDGAGRVVVIATPLDATSGDFPLQPAYLPFVRSAVRYASGDVVERLWRTVGDAWPIPPAVRSPVIRSPDGAVTHPASDTGVRAVTFDQSGFYQVFEGSASGDPVATVATNPPAGESDLTAMRADELLLGVGRDSMTAAALATASIGDIERRQQLWRVLLLLGFVAAVAECSMASRGWRGSAARVVGVTRGGAS